MTSPVTNRQFLADLAKSTLEALHDEPAGLEAIGDVHPDAVTNSLEAALDWVRLEGSAATLESVEATAAAEPYLPYNQTLSLLQSAYDEYIESVGITEMPFDANDPGWKTIAEEKLKAASRPKHPFIAHTTVEDFRYELPDNAVVALFSEWGTGEPTAQRVMEQISAAHPTYAIDLGDVYSAETQGSHASGSSTLLSVLVPQPTPVAISPCLGITTTTAAAMATSKVCCQFWGRRQATSTCAIATGRSSGLIPATKSMGSRNRRRSGCMHN
jgi:hypothetical protein